MLAQKLVRWNPLDGLEKYYNIEILTEDHDELKIVFYPDKDKDGNYGKSLQIRCKQPVLFYKKLVGLNQKLCLYMQLNLILNVTKVV